MSISKIAYAIPIAVILASGGIAAQTMYVPESAPKIVYTSTPCGDPDLAGCFRIQHPHEIQVKSTMAPADIAGTIIHETHHWQLWKDHDSRYNNECYVSSLTLADGYSDAYHNPNSRFFCG